MRSLQEILDDPKVFVCVAIDSRGNIVHRGDENTPEGLELDIRINGRSVMVNASGTLTGYDEFIDVVVQGFQSVSASSRINVNGVNKISGVMFI